MGLLIEMHSDGKSSGKRRAGGLVAVTKVVVIVLQSVHRRGHGHVDAFAARPSSSNGAMAKVTSRFPMYLSCSAVKLRPESKPLAHRSVASCKSSSLASNLPSPAPAEAASSPQRSGKQSSRAFAHRPGHCSLASSG